MPKKPATRKQLSLEVEALRARLDDAEETLRGIRSGEVDSLVVPDVDGDWVFVLKGADRSYRILIEEMNEGAATLTAEGVILYANRRFAEMLKTPLEKVIGSAIHTWIARADQEIFQALLRRDDAETRSRGEVTLLAGDGTPVPGHLSINVLQIEEMRGLLCMTVTDLTVQKRTEAIIASEKSALESIEAANRSRLALLSVIEDQKQAEKALRESEAKFRNYIECAPDGVFIADDTGRYIEVNKSACRITGFSKEEIEKMSIRDLLAEESSEDGLAHFKKVMETGAATSDLWHKHKDGSKRYLTIGAVRLSVTRVLGFAKDITERKRAEEEHRKLEEQLRASQKMEAIGSLAGGIAHDFNNMLTVILSFTGFALDGLREGDPIRDDLMEVKKAGERAAALTRQLLAFSRRQILELKSLDMNEVITEIEKMLRRIIGEDVDLVKVLAPDLHLTLADPGQIAQVLMNLAINARDAMPDGGKLTIETANVVLDEGYAAGHVGVNPGSYVSLVVSDTGCGMDEQTRSRIFEPFFTTKEIGKGTGLGLSTAYGIVEQCGGNILVYSEPDKGTTFKVYLPRVLAADIPVPVVPALSIRTVGTETILVVEDEEAIRNLAKRLLVTVGYTVLTAVNADEALTACERYKGNIHLLLTDVVMPMMDGRTLAEKISVVRPGIKVLYMSGYADNAIVRHGVLDPGVHFIGKPFTVEDFTRKVHEVLEQNL